MLPYRAINSKTRLTEPSKRSSVLGKKMMVKEDEKQKGSQVEDLKMPL